MSRLLITGATGFIGSRTVRLLLKQNHQVAILLRDPGNAWRIADLLDRVTVIPTDLEGAGVARPDLQRFAPEILVHLAWAGVTNRERNELSQLRNLSLSYHLLEQAHAAGCQSYIGVGSQAEYGPVGQIVDVGRPCFPTTVYGAAKLCHNHEAAAYCQRHGLRFAWMRVFSTYGPGEDPSWMVSYVTRSLLKKERPALTKGEQRWDYLFGDDAGEAVARVALAPQAQGVYNLGSGQAYPLREVIEQIRDLVDPTLELGFGEVPYRPDQVMWLQADIRRLTEDTGWTPRVELREGLRQAVEWIRQHPHEQPGAAS